MRLFTFRPTITLRGRTFHGLRKFHLNNAVQDGSFLHELISGEIFRAGVVAATRVAHARVWLNDRELGLYVGIATLAATEIGTITRIVARLLTSRNC